MAPMQQAGAEETPLPHTSSSTFTPPPHPSLYHILILPHHSCPVVPLWFPSLPSPFFVMPFAPLPNDCCLSKQDLSHVVPS